MRGKRRHDNNSFATITILIIRQQRRNYNIKFPRADSGECVLNTENFTGLTICFCYSKITKSTSPRSSAG